MKALFLGLIGALAIFLLLVLPLLTNEIPRVFKEEEQPRAEATIMFGGDMMFDRYIRQISESIGGDYLFSCIDHALFTADAVVANLEGPITHEASVTGTDENAAGHFTFTFPPETAGLLARHNIFLVNIGNNHILNFGDDGLMQTKQLLAQSDVAYFDTNEPLELEIEGVPFTFITYNEFSTTDSSTEKHSNILKNVGMSRERGRVPVVYAHWGEEYALVNETQRSLAHDFVDAGAALVVGSHPHVVQEVERYNDVSIYYSLGNFIFDQYFSEAVKSGLLLSVTFDAEGVNSIQEVPIRLHTDGRTCVADPVER